MTVYPSPKKPNRLAAATIAVAALAGLCCGGAAVVNKLSPAEPAAAPIVTATTRAERLAGALPSASPTAEVGVAAPSSTPPASPTVKPSPAPRRTAASTPTRKPAPKPATAKPRPKPTTAVPRAPSAQHGVHPGAFCSPQGAIGHTVKGTRMRCTKEPGDIRARWRAA